MRPAKRVSSPTLKELYVLRFMIMAGIAAMIFFLYHLLKPSVIDNGALYSLLIVALTFTSLKFLHEWYHYFYITVPATPPTTRTYTVDIFTTYCAGEPYKMMEETLTAIQAIRYPHTSYLCDEANDPYMIELCRKLGIHHITRDKKINAKAGNINNALQFATGELCVVLDPDHVPFPEFLDPIVSHFEKPEVGFVQVVQAYKNFNEGLIAHGAAQQTFQFYGPMMMTMNRYGTVLAIGANCTFRRSALDSINGHAAGLAEDMHTAMQLHAQGWKSVYVPEVLARGLVPATLSAYYSQQLKWSRGVFELLVTSYPKLFSKFTWRQKLHYGIIPLYYLSGFVFLINFLIPVLSLFLEQYPVKMDFNTFALILLPLVILVMLIRNYVQRWVMEDEERGFHIVGGLLAIGTWWVFILGFVYTIFRKKVPYVPTPKDANEENNWPLNVPNLVVLAVSIFAILYGLSTDWNPYTFVMAALAAVNCFILLFNILASRQMDFRNIKERNKLLYTSSVHAFNARKSFWRFRLKFYSALRRVALFLTLITLAITSYFAFQRSSDRTVLTENLVKKEIFLNGIFAPVNSSGLSSMKLVNSYQAHFDIVSLYIAWGDSQKNYLPKPLIDSIYRAGAIPMITWEPWQNLFNRQHAFQKDSKVLQKIYEGEYDDYLKSFALDVRKLKRPVYIRFAHEADNPFYPWSASGGNTGEDFKKAWQYVHRFFQNQGAHNAIWVWNPWKAEAVSEFFPGKQFVDWIGITNLNYGKFGPDTTYYSMEQLYRPFHRQEVIRSGIPVMLAEMGSLTAEGNQNEWFAKARATLKYKFPEIKAFVLFNSGLDRNLPVQTNLQYLDWRVENPGKVFPPSTQSAKAEPVELLEETRKPGIRPARNPVRINFENTWGVNYTKGLNWVKNYHLLRKKEVLADLHEMKQMGFKTIKRYGPGAYDENILNIARQNKLDVHYGFFMPENINFTSDDKEMADFEKLVISTVKKMNHHEEIVAWNLANMPIQNFENRYYKPERVYHEYAYARWLGQLIGKIKLIDPGRPIAVDLEVNDALPQMISFLNHHVNGIDYFGLIITDRSPSDFDFKKINVPYFISKIDAKTYLQRNSREEGFFIADWQDQERSDLVSFDGLKDNWGRSKGSLYHLKSSFRGTKANDVLPRVKILRPAITIFSNRSYRYHALVEVNKQWVLADSVNLNLKYDWYLVKTDRFGNGLTMEYLNSGTKVSVQVSGNPAEYQLYLNAVKGNSVTTARSILNIPIRSATQK